MEVDRDADNRDADRDAGSSPKNDCSPHDKCLLEPSLAGAYFIPVFHQLV